MKKLVFLLVLALELAVCGCGSNTIAPTTSNTSASGNWEGQITGGSGQASLLNFLTTFSIYDTGPLDIKYFGFFNDGACFTKGTVSQPGSSETGTAALTTDTQTDQVTGTFSLTVLSIMPKGNKLFLQGNITGTSNATPQVTGILSNGVVEGTWTLTGGAGDPSCSGTGNFIMCQGTETCTPAT